MATSNAWIALSLVAISVFYSLAHGQLLSCTTSMIMTFTPCITFVTGGSGGGGALRPSQACCAAMGKLATDSTDCLCSLMSGAVPFGLPFNQSLAYKLPIACGGPSAPLFQCKNQSLGNGTIPLPPFGLSPPRAPPPPPVVVVAPPPVPLNNITSAAMKHMDMVINPIMFLVISLLLVIAIP